MISNVPQLIPAGLAAGLALWLVSGLLAALSPGPRLSRTLAALGVGSGAVSLGGAALGTLLSGATTALPLWQPVPFAAFDLRLDPLAAFFLLVIAAVSVPVAIYTPAYVAHDPHYSARRLGLLTNLFLLSMALVVLAGNAFAFLIVWEGMALVSYLLVMTDQHDAQVTAAGFIYLVMTHTGTAFLTVAFLGFYAATGTFDFAAWTAAAPLPPLIRDGIFLCALIGFGTKAGVIPLHIWLPRAHPVAPSPVSALMSGVMLKTAIYGLVRVIFDFFGGRDTPPLWWGEAILGLGLVSAVLGVLYALMESDLKRLLAYSSIENIGIILLGLGASLLLLSMRQPALAGLALFAALFHTLNHALFKALLFLGAGAIQYATGTRQIDALGGLARRMPGTAACFLVGAIAISGLPPFNGFASEWLTFQGLFTAGAALSPIPAIAALIAAGGLALTAGLAAACFVKAFGVTFLALPRTGAAVQGVAEVPRGMRVGMGLLALACLVLGVVPGSIRSLVEAVLRQLRVAAPTGSAADGLPNPAAIAGLGALAPGILLIGGLVLLPLPWLLTRGRPRRGRP
ncbi:MAG TPA: proton-conducting transporter membrane subunit, partial [Chloroflexia bacterium]|nr:proton-conducting transporter membrane subunit [Chloroflexia bacterium]